MYRKGRGGMLSPEEIEKIKFEIQKLRESLAVCPDTGLKKMIEAVIEQHEQKLESERDAK
jgi:hypothetical protein